MLDFEIKKYYSRWEEGAIKLQKSVRTLSAIVQAAAVLPLIRNGLALPALWTEYTRILAAVTAPFAHELLADEGDYSGADLPLKPIHCLVSLSVQAYLDWLQHLLSDWECDALLLGVVLNLYLDTSSSSGQIMAQRILNSLLASRHESIGIVAVERNDSEDGGSEDDEEENGGGEGEGLDNGDDRSSKSSRSRSSGELSDAAPAGEANEEIEDSFALTEATATALKQALVVIAQALSSSGRTHSVVSLYGADSVSSTGTSASILGNIKKNIEDW